MKYFIELSYDGTNYFGWQNQPNHISIQEVIEQKLSVILRERINIVGAGRTDAGVHAKQMYAHFVYSKKMDLDKIVFKINSFLPQDISINKIYAVDDGAHARFDAIYREYEYHIHIGKNPFKINKSYQINDKLDIENMNKAAAKMLEFTDFKCFSKSKTDVKTYNCSIKKAEWVQNGNDIIFYVSADRFLRNMVRAIVGSLLDVGRNKKSVSDFIKIIESRNRSMAGVSVPAKGLYLTKVTYTYI